MLTYVKEKAADPLDIVEAVSDADVGFQLPESVEESLLDAVVAYLKETERLR